MAQLKAHDFRKQYSKFCNVCPVSTVTLSFMSARAANILHEYLEANQSESWLLPARTNYDSKTPQPQLTGYV
jgi:hypothetical protein